MTNTFDLNGLTLDELKGLENQIKEAKVAAREQAKVDAKAAKDARIEQFKGSIGEGDTVSFLYGRDNETFTGNVVRASEKSVTVKADVFAENGKKDTNYVRYDRIVEILEKAEVAETEDEAPVEAVV